MSGFDFRAALGGHVEVPADPVLADGIDGKSPLPGLCAHAVRQLPNIDGLVDVLARGFLMNVNYNGLCAGAVMALLIQRIDGLTEGLPEGLVDAERRHFRSEVLAALERLEGRG